MIGSGNGLSPIWHQAITVTLTDANLLSIWPSGKKIYVKFDQNTKIPFKKKCMTIGNYDLWMADILFRSQGVKYFQWIQQRNLFHLLYRLKWFHLLCQPHITRFKFSWRLAEPTYFSPDYWATSEMRQDILYTQMEEDQLLLYADLTHWGWVMHICISKLCQHRFRQWLVP